MRVLSRTAPYDHCTMTVLDDVDDAVGRPLRRAAAVDVVRRSRRATAARARRPASSGDRAHRRATPSSKPPSTGSGSTAPTARSWSRATRTVSRRAAGRRARRARLRRGRARPRQAGARRAADGRRGRGSRHAPGARRRPGHVVPPAGPPLAACRIRRRRRRRSGSSSGGRRPGARWVGAERSRRSPTPHAGARRRRAAGVVGTRGPRRGGRTGRPGTRVPAATARRACGPTGPAGSTRRRSPRSGTRQSAIDWGAPIEHGRRVEAAVVQVMTFLIENEEAALVVPARFLGQIHPHFREIQQMLADHGGRRGPPHRGLHPPGHDDRPRARAVDRRRTGVAADAARRTRLRHRRVPAVGDGRGHVRVAARLPRTPRPRRRHAPHRPSDPPGRGPPRGVRARPPRAPRRDRARPPRPAGAGRRATPPSARRAPPGSTTTSSTRSCCSPPATDTPDAIAAGLAARAGAAARDGRSTRGPASARLGFTDGEAETLSSLHTRNFM